MIIVLSGFCWLHGVLVSGLFTIVNTGSIINMVVFVVVNKAPLLMC